MHFANGKTHRAQFDPELAVAWIDLKFFGRSLVCMKGRAILNEINGSIDFGTLNALMGPSGAGKSTLLKCINGRQKTSRDTNIYLSFDGKIKPCFIVQDVSNHLLNGLTGIQSLIYASKLKNINKQCDHKRNARKLLSDLMISDIERTPVENCSGGEQKRLVIAMELTPLKKPNVLCIDEPTSGLDSNAAEIVVQCLKGVSRQHNIAVVTSIHQPNNDVLMLFDKLYVLGKGGHCMFDGPPQDLAPYLEKAGIDCTEFQVPIEVLLKIASKKDDRFQALARLNRANKTDLIQRCVTEGRLCSSIPQRTADFKLKHFWYLLLRTLTYTFRSQWRSMIVQIVFILTIALMITQLFNERVGEPDGCFTFDITPNATCQKTKEALRIEDLLSQNLRFHFFAEILIQFLLIVATTLIFASEVRIFFNEHKNGWYSTGAYYWAKSVVELPLCLLITVCYVVIVYKINTQIDDQKRFLGYIALTVSGVVCSQGLGFLVGIISNANDKLAIVMAIGLYLVNVMLCGFFAPLEELPEAVRWLPHLSFVKHCFENHLIVIYGFDRCPDGQLQSILYQMNLMDDTEDKFVLNAIELAVATLAYRLLALLVLLLKANPISIRFPRRAVSSNEKISVSPTEQIIHM